MRSSPGHRERHRVRGKAQARPRRGGTPVSACSTAGRGARCKHLGDRCFSGEAATGDLAFATADVVIGQQSSGPFTRRGARCGVRSRRWHAITPTDADSRVLAVESDREVPFGWDVHLGGTLERSLPRNGRSRVAFTPWGRLCRRAIASPRAEAGEWSYRAAQRGRDVRSGGAARTVRTRACIFLALSYRIVGAGGRRTAMEGAAGTTRQHLRDSWRE